MSSHWSSLNYNALSLYINSPFFYINRHLCFLLILRSEMSLTHAPPLRLIIWDAFFERAKLRHMQEGLQYRIIGRPVGNEADTERRRNEFAERTRALEAVTAYYTEKLHTMSILDLVQEGIAADTLDNQYRSFTTIVQALRVFRLQPLVDCYEKQEERSVGELLKFQEDAEAWLQAPQLDIMLSMQFGPGKIRLCLDYIRAKLEEMHLAFAEGMHSRLGENSHLRSLDPNLLRSMVRP